MKEVIGYARDVTRGLKRKFEDEWFEQFQPGLYTFEHMQQQIPQIDAYGNVRFLYDCGLAVRAITGANRHVSDVDIVRFAPMNYEIGLYRAIGNGTQKWKGYIDDVTPVDYWNKTEISSNLLKETAYTASLTVRDKEYTIQTVNPAVILTNKLFQSAHKLSLKDSKDVQYLLQFQNRTGYEWNSVFDEMLAGFPPSDREKMIELKKLTERNL